MLPVEMSTHRVKWSLGDSNYGSIRNFVQKFSLFFFLLLFFLFLVLGKVFATIVFAPLFSSGLRWVFIEGIDRVIGKANEKWY